MVHLRTSWMSCMSSKQKFQIFFLETKCYKVGKGYVVYAPGWQKCAEGSTASGAWDDAWYTFKARIFANIGTHYASPWIETNYGFQIIGQPSGPDPVLDCTWEHLRIDPKLRHLWSDILVALPEPARPVSILDLLVS